MALLKTLNFGPVARVYLWRIEESAEELAGTIKLQVAERERLKAIHHPAKKAEFLALRSCLKLAYGTNPPVSYYKNGKPYLENGHYISFSHTTGYAAVAISEQHPVGVDLEFYRPGIKKVARKYMRPEESEVLQIETEVEQLLLYWGAKESMIKIIGDRRMDFKQQLRVRPFHYRAFQSTDGMIYQQGDTVPVNLIFRKVEEVYLTLGWLREPGVGKASDK